MSEDGDTGSRGGHSEGLATRALAVVAAGTLLEFAFGVRTQLESGDGILLVTELLLYVAAFAFFVAAVIDINYDRWIPMGAAVALVGLAVAVLAWYRGHALAQLGADSMLHTQYATDLVLSGHNPYTADMTDAYSRYPVDPKAVTRLTDGTVISTYIYPGASVLPFVPQRALGLPNGNLTAVAAWLGVGAWLVYALPARLHHGGVAAVVASTDLFWFSTGGVWDMVWVLPLLGAMHYWAAERYRPAAILLGITGAIKPQPWFVAPFLALWLVRQYPARAARRHLTTCLVYGGGVFAALNLPFVLAAPRAWVVAMARPLGVGGARPVLDGAGPVVLATHGGLPIPASAFTAAFGLTAVVAAIAYYRYDALRWTAWLMPALLLWVGPRSTHNYVLAFLPVAAYAAVLAARDESGTAVGTDGGVASAAAADRGLANPTVRMRLLRAVNRLAHGLYRGQRKRTLRGSRLYHLLFDSYARFVAAVCPDRTAVRVGGWRATVSTRTAGEAVAVLNTLCRERAVLDRVLDDVERGTVVWDLGANVGLYSTLAAAAGATVVAAEPYPPTAACIRENARLNGLGHAVSVKSVAVHETDGHLSLRVERPTAGTCTPMVTDAERGDRRVPAVAGDTVLADWPTPDIIKMDVEGVERAALSGMADVLSEGPIIYVEVHDDASEPAICRLLRKHGYDIQQVHAFDAESYLRATPTNADAVQGETE